MTDPKKTPAGSAEEPAASNPGPAAPITGPGLIPTPAGYQFSSRKARREAELTGMIPIIVPKKAAEPTSPAEVAEAQKTVDAGPGSSAPVTDTVAGKATPSSANASAPSPHALPKPADATPAPGRADSLPATPAQAATKPSDTSVEARAADMAAHDAPQDGSPQDGPAQDKSGVGAKTRSQARAERAAAAKAVSAKSATTKLAGEKTSRRGSAAGKKSAADRKSAADSGPVAGQGSAEPKSSAAKKESAARIAALDVVPGGRDTRAPAVPEALDASAKRTNLESTPPKPVSAVQVTGLPVIPSPGGPIVAMPEEVTEAKLGRTPKAGRDLPAAIGVGVALLVLVIGSMLFYPVAFVAVATAFACAGTWELGRALAGKGIVVPMTPVMVGALAMPASSYFAGPEGLLFALVASAGATVLWRSLDAQPGGIKSILAGVFTLTWIPFLLSFVFLMIRDEHGPTTELTLDLSNINPGVVQLLIMLFLVVANDTFGYLVGVLFGKHPMAPKISPKKSWEGFAGSLAGATLVAVPATVFLLDQHWWVGLVLAIGLVFAATGGDFAESMVKRELGVKDMSNLLPGHGGVMDRLDSILFAAPMAYVIFTVVGSF